MHNMILIAEHEGSEQWYCPYCGRRLRVSWEPQVAKTILEAGDETAIHSGSLVCSQTESIDSIPGDSLVPRVRLDESVEELWLVPWMTWMEERGFATLWKDDQ